MGIRGPRSALSKFLEEENIKVKNIKSERGSDTQKVQEEAGFKIQKKQRIKKIRYSKPVEIVNLRQEITLKSTILQKIHLNLENYRLSDDHMLEYSKFLYDQNLLTQEIFDYLVECATDKLVIYDCSMIERFEVFKGLKHLELHYCGQLKQHNLNEILKKQNRLETLKLTGAFLLESIDLSLLNNTKIREIDVSSCSRLNDGFIEQINELGNLELLNISFCYGITKKASLRINVNKIVADETKITRKFFKMKDLSMVQELSIKNCPLLFMREKNVLDFSKFENLKRLNIEGISQIREINIDGLVELRAANCFNLELPFHCQNLKILDITKINYAKEILEKILQFSMLEHLNLSFNENVDDSLIFGLLKTLKCINTVVIFGCFELTKELGKLAWSIKSSIKIIGNHAETRFLLEN